MIESILKFFVNLLTRWQNRESLKTFGAARSYQWPKVRAEHLRLNPACAVCGKDVNCVPHHVIPFFIEPSLELSFTNLITLCEGSGNHHLWVGHLGNFKSHNPNVREDAKIWKAKIENRP